MTADPAEPAAQKLPAKLVLELHEGYTYINVEGSPALDGAIVAYNTHGDKFPTALSAERMAIVRAIVERYNAHGTPSSAQQTE